MASSCLSFIERNRNSKSLFLYREFLEKEIEHTHNAAKIIFSLFKPQYKVIKQFQIRGGAQAHFGFFTLRHNFRKFPRGKRKGSSPAQLEGLNISLNDWSDLHNFEDKASLKESLFLSGRAKEAIFSEGG